MKGAAFLWSLLVDGAALASALQMLAPGELWLVERVASRSEATSLTSPTRLPLLHPSPVYFLYPYPLIVCV